MRQRHVMLFEPGCGGHRGQYIGQLVDHWGRHRLAGRLDVVVPEPFVERHDDVVSLASRHAASDIRILPTPIPDLPMSGKWSQLIRADLTHGRILERAISTRRPDHCLLMHVDHLLLSLAFRLRFDFPVLLSGIYFRPTFHYHAFSGPPPGARARLAGLRKRAQLAAAARNRHFRYLFSLDPYAVEHLGRSSRQMAAVHLPDGAATPAESVETRTAGGGYGIAEGRKVAVMFGSLTRRKGVDQLLRAVGHLSRQLQERLCLLLAGRIPEQDRSDVLGKAESLRRTTPVQIVIEDRFLDDAEIPAMLGGADLILVTYQRHTGSSNVLVRAAAAGVPVLGPEFGLMGELIRRRHLGMTVDATDPSAIARGIEQCLGTPGGCPFDPGQARRFAQENTVERFAATIFDRLLDDGTPPAGS